MRALAFLLLVGCAGMPEGTYDVTAKRTSGTCETVPRPTVRMDVVDGSMDGVCPLAEQDDGTYRAECLGGSYAVAFEGEGFAGTLEYHAPHCSATWALLGVRRAP